MIYAEPLLVEIAGLLKLFFLGHGGAARRALMAARSLSWIYSFTSVASLFVFFVCSDAGVLFSCYITSRLCVHCLKDRQTMYCVYMSVCRFENNLLEI